MSRSKVRAGSIGCDNSFLESQIVSKTTTGVTEVTPVVVFCFDAEVNYFLAFLPESGTVAMVCKMRLAIL